MQFPVPLPEHLLTLAATLGLKPEDVEEHFTRGSGHGGQKVNKTSSCVELTHRPSGIMVRLQEHREQHRNREAAWVLLIEKLAEKSKEATQQQQHTKFLKDKKRSRRPHHVQEEILEGKKFRGELKKRRRNIV